MTMFVNVNPNAVIEPQPLLRSVARHGSAIGGRNLGLFRRYKRAFDPDRQVFVPEIRIGVVGDTAI